MPHEITTWAQTVLNPGMLDVDRSSNCARLKVSVAGNNGKSNGKTHTHRHTDTQTHRHTDTQTHRHTDTQTHRHTDTQTHRHTDTQTHRHTDTQTHRHTDSQTHRHTDTDTDTDTHTHTHTHTHTENMTRKLGFIGMYKARGLELFMKAPGKAFRYPKHTPLGKSQNVGVWKRSSQRLLWA